MLTTKGKMNFLPHPRQGNVSPPFKLPKRKKKMYFERRVHMVVNAYKSQPLVKFASYFHYLRVKTWQGGINLGSLKI